MIRHLNEKIRKLMLLLMIVIIACITVAVYVVLYYGALRSEKEELRSLSREVGLKQVIDPEYAKDELEWLPYAAVQVPRKDNADYLEAVMGQERHLGYIREEVVRMNHLIMEMLTLARLDSAEEFYDTTEFSLDEAVLEVAYPFEGVAFEKFLKLTIDVQENMRFIGESQQLQKVVSILLDNAISYSLEQGEISVKAYKTSGAYVLEVANTGKEIPREVQKNLFERFYRQDELRTEAGNHFGLGLSIAYEIVKKHRGTIAVASGGGWNTFTVTLPYEAKEKRCTANTAARCG